MTGGFDPFRFGAGGGGARGIPGAPQDGQIYALERGVWTALNPVNTVAPVLSPASEAFYGSPLSLSNGTWSGSPTSYVYGWEVSTDGVSFTTIAGEADNTFTPDSSYNGKYVRGVVIAYNGVGSSSPAYSSPTAQLGPNIWPTCLAWWPLGNNGSGGLNLADQSGHGYNATNYGATLGTGLVGGCAVCTGGRGLTSTFARSPGQSSTWVFCFNGTNSKMIDAAWGSGFLFSLSSSNHLQVSFVRFSGLWTITSDSVVSGWNQAILVNDAVNGLVTLYINGVQSASKSYSGTLSTFFSGWTGHTNLALGARIFLPPFNSSFAGSLEQVGVFSIPFTSADAAAFWNSGTPLTYPS